MNNVSKRIITLRVDSDLVDELAEIRRLDVGFDRTYVITRIMTKVLQDVSTSVLWQFLRSPYDMDRWCFTLERKASDSPAYEEDEPTPF